LLPATCHAYFLDQDGTLFGVIIALYFVAYLVVAPNVATPIYFGILCIMIAITITDHHLEGFVFATVCELLMICGTITASLFW